MAKAEQISCNFIGQIDISTNKITKIASRFVGQLIGHSNLFTEVKLIDAYRQGCGGRYKKINVIKCFLTEDLHYKSFHVRKRFEQGNVT